MSQPLLHVRDIALAEPPRMVPGTYHVATWGCQMNDEDSEQMGLYLEGIGFTKTDELLEAQVVVLNTCSVRKKPEDKAFSLLGELVPLKKARPQMVVGVCGCMAQVRADEIRRRAPHVDFVIGTGHVANVATLVQETLDNRRFQKLLELPERKGATVDDLPQRQVSSNAKLKAFVPIQYGCDKFCTYCIVPSTRGRERSREPQDIVDEVRQLCLHGTKEITLLGQTVNSYGKTLPTGKLPFSDLLWRLSEIEMLERIRFISPYPRDFRADLIETIRDCPKVMEHVHLPLQSGDDDVLRAMKRVYSVESFTEIASALRAAVPSLSITTDIIVGFPGETEQQFENTLRAMKDLQFDGAFMFAYSIRPDTPAGDREDQVPEPVKRERLNRLIQVQNEITAQRNAALVGSEFEVLVEGASPKNRKVLQGYSREFRMIHFSGDALPGQTRRVRALSSHPWGLKGALA